MKKRLLVLTLFVLLLCACGAKKQPALADGSYSVGVTLSGGTGRSTILSPAALEVQDGQLTVTFIWSSSNYDYMIVNDVKYEPVTYDGGSTFRIPLQNLEPLTIVADTVAMSTPHEITYTVTFDTPAK